MTVRLAPQVTLLDGSPGALAGTARQLATALAGGSFPADRTFDAWLPSDLRSVSKVYWTPMVVIARIVDWLQRYDIRSVVDLGSGAGKFCVAGALAAVDCRFVGIEQRGRLVEAARALGEVFELGERVSFIEGAIDAVRVPRADAYYLFNPFGENLFGAAERLDGDVELSDERYTRDVATVVDLLHRARLGTYLITYNGFGVRPPPSYEAMVVDRSMDCELRLWRKTSGIRPGVAHHGEVTWVA